MCVVHLGLCIITNASLNYSTASDVLALKLYTLGDSLINHLCSHTWLEPLVSTDDTGGFKPCMALQHAWIQTTHGHGPRL